jgi:hypothetical protein
MEAAGVFALPSAAACALPRASALPRRVAALGGKPLSGLTLRPSGLSAPTLAGAARVRRGARAKATHPALGCSRAHLASHQLLCAFFRRVRFSRAVLTPRALCSRRRGAHVRQFQGQRARGRGAGARLAIRAGMGSAHMARNERAG